MQYRKLAGRSTGDIKNRIDFLCGVFKLIYRVLEKDGFSFGKKEIEQKTKVNYLIHK